MARISLPGAVSRLLPKWSAQLRLNEPLEPVQVPLPLVSWREGRPYCALCMAADATEFDNCLSNAQRGACAAQAGSISGCVADYADGGVGMTICSSPEGALQVICGSGP